MSCIRILGVFDRAHDESCNALLEIRFPRFQLPFNGHGHAFFHARHEACLLEQRNLLQLHIEWFTNRFALQEFVPCIFTQNGEKSLPLLLHRFQGQQFRRVATRIYFEQVAAGIGVGGGRCFFGQRAGEMDALLR